jgi:molybdenum cofactor biosynthesis enzyme MoaA
MKFKLEDMLFVRPPILQFEVEDRCNMSCPMCITRSHRASSFDRLTLSEIKSLLLARFRFAGGCQLILAGGEPTLSEELEDILKYSDRIGLSIHLATNLYQVDTEKMRRILEIMAGIQHEIMVSYDSACPDEMQAIRGIDAHHTVTSNLISLLQMKKESGAATKILVAITLQERNSQSIADTIEFLMHLDLDRIFIQPINLYGEINETNFHLVNPSCSRQDLPSLLEAVDTVFLMARENQHIHLCYPDIERWRRHFSSPTHQDHICQSNKIIHVNRYGDYYGCLQSRAYANIREIGMVDFLKSEIYKEHRRLIMKCNICTHECS